MRIVCFDGIITSLSLVLRHHVKNEEVFPAVDRHYLQHPAALVRPFPCQVVVPLTRSADLTHGLDSAEHVKG